MSELIRIDKFISSQLNISRSDSKKIIKSNAVVVNGAVVRKADIIIDAYKDCICVSGKEIKFKKHIYLMMNKPKDVVSATTDNREITVLDIIPERFRRNGLFPAGRLDKNTTGFMLITDDGEFAHNILSPSHHVKKTYIAHTETMLSDDNLDVFVKGMKIGNEYFKPAEIRFLFIKDDNFCYEIKIVEGRYHQVKRMFAFVGHPVIALERVKIGNLSLDETLKPGEVREITEAELKLITEVK